MQVDQTLKNIGINSRVAVVVSATTATTGVGQWMEYIPDSIGKLGTLVGIILSLVLIASHCLKMYTSWKQAQLDYREAEIMLNELESRVQEGDSPPPSTKP